jgi:hypothetical protein
MEIVHTKYLGLFQIDIRIGGVMVSVLASSEVDSMHYSFLFQCRVIVA